MLREMCAKCTEMQPTKLDDLAINDDVEQIVTFEAYASKTLQQVACWGIGGNDGIQIKTKKGFVSIEWLTIIEICLNIQFTSASSNNHSLRQYAYI